MKSWPTVKLGKVIMCPFLVYLLLFCPNIPFWFRFSHVFIYIFQYLALFTYIYQHLVLCTLIWLYLPLIALIWPYIPYSPYIDVFLVRLHLCANLKQSDMEILHLKLCDLNLTFKGNTRSKILRPTERLYYRTSYYVFLINVGHNMLRLWRTAN